jgi:hypothetical protein
MDVLGRSSRNRCCYLYETKEGGISTKVHDGGSTGVQKMEIDVLDDRWVIKERVGREKRSFSIAIKESIDQYSSGMRYAKKKPNYPTQSRSSTILE